MLETIILKFCTEAKVLETVVPKHVVPEQREHSWVWTTFPIAAYFFASILCWSKGLSLKYKISKQRDSPKDGKN